MNQEKEQVRDVVEQWLGAWWQWVSPIQSVSHSPVFNGYLEDVHEAYQKVLGYWLERPEFFQERMSQCAIEFAEVMDDLDTDDISESELLESIRTAQKITAEKVLLLISQTENLSRQEALLLRFTLRQIMSFVDPRNSFFSNPEILKKSIETEGLSLVAGIQKYRQDLEKSTFGLEVLRSDQDENPIGNVIATTRGSVIFQNELIQLIHYEAVKEQQNSVPLLLVPPCINKFYILDLMPNNSFVRWLCDQGHDVYMISWVNPEQSLSSTSFDDYVQKGCLDAVDVVIDFAEVESVNLLGYCIGGLMASIAAETERGRPKIKSLTLLATLLEYSSSGELEIFVSDRMISALEQEIEKDGLLKSEFLSLAFTLLREEKLLWAFVRRRYFLGESLPFDALLHWGQDGVHLPGKMALEYIDYFYRKNCLGKDKCYYFGDESVFLSQSKTPKYVLACEKDHIAPAEAVIRGSELLGGDIRQVIASGGHASGVINHPSLRRGKYKVNGSDKGYIDDSWWNDWQQWVTEHAGDKIDARPKDKDDFPSIEPAPGKFVC